MNGIDAQFRRVDLVGAPSPTVQRIRLTQLQFGVVPIGRIRRAILTAIVAFLLACSSSYAQENQVPQDAARSDTKLANNSIHYSAAIAKLKSAVEYEVEQKQLPAFSLSMVDSDRVIWMDFRLSWRLCRNENLAWWPPRLSTGAMALSAVWPISPCGS